MSPVITLTHSVLASDEMISIGRTSSCVVTRGGHTNNLPKSRVKFEY